jgi:hypothetical protein
MHTLNLDFIREYLNDDKVKSVLCEKGAHCTHFVCRFGHDYDHDILGYSDPENPDQTIFEFDEDHRDTARKYWRDAKQDAYNIELLDGSRKPKNKRDHQLLDRLRTEAVAVNSNNFPTMQSELSIVPIHRSRASSDENDDTENDTENDMENDTNVTNVNDSNNSYNMVTQTNLQFNGIVQYFNSYPDRIQDPVINQLFQIAIVQNQLINNSYSINN